jgi:hypothetical protein
VQAVKTKILLEIAGAVPAEPLVKPARAPDKRANCMAGEHRLQNRWGN